MATNTEDKGKVFYNSRTWLNEEDSHFTGSLVCFDGIVKNQGREADRYSFVELASCHGKVRLHTDKNSGNQDEQSLQLAAKLILLRNEVDGFIQHLLTTVEESLEAQNAK
jgi:hypothetical protein